MKRTEPLIQPFHFRAVWTWIVALLPVSCLLMLPFFHRPRGHRAEIEAVCCTCEEDDREWSEYVKSVDGIKHARQPSVYATDGRPFRGQRQCQYRGEGCLHREVDGEEVGLQSRELCSR